MGIETELEQAAHDRATMLTRTIVRLLAAATVAVVALSFLDPQNDLRVTFAMHGIDGLLLLGAWWALRRGKQRLAAWIVSWMFWTVVSLSCWLFGGLQYELAGAYLVIVMLAGTTLGSREAMFFALLGIAMSTVVLFAHLEGVMPEPITPPSVVNAWISVTISLLLGAYLLRVFMKSLEHAMTRVRENAIERDTAQRRLLQAQKMEPVGRLAAGVAHDFNNLLSAMTNITGVLRRRVGDDPRVGPLLDDLEGATDRAAMMTRQLLAFSRARAPAFEVFELDPLLERSVPLLSRLVGDDVTVDVRLEAPEAHVRADRGQLEQVLLNLTVNARDAMPKGGTLTIASGLLDDGDRVVITVRDTGGGIDPESRAQLFEPFFTTKSTGTGLGLATVHEIVRAAGGSIEVETTGPDGTCFRVELPKHEPREPTMRTSTVPSPDSLPSGLRLLLVEDHELVRRTTRQALEDAGFDVTTVRDGVEALLLLEGGTTFDGMVTDLRMPRLSGEALADALERRGRLLPVVFVSGHEERLPESLEKLEVPKRFLSKPYAPEVLVHTVKSVLREGIQHRLRRIAERE